jgi:hypothetical protein
MGRTIPGYAYVNSNPIMFTDSSGLIIQGFENLDGETQQLIMALRETAAGMAAWDAMQKSGTIFLMRMNPGLSKAGQVDATGHPERGFLPIGVNFVHVEFNSSNYPREPGRESYLAKDVTPLHAVAHELVGHAVHYAGPVSEWPALPQDRWEQLRREEQADRDAAQASGVELRESPWSDPKDSRKQP